MSTGKTTYGTSRWDGSSASSTSAVSSAAPSSSCQPRNPPHPRVAHVRMSGVTTRAPEKSDSHHVRQTSANWSRDDVAQAQRRGCDARADQPRPRRQRRVRRRRPPVPGRCERRSGGAARVAATRISSVLPSVWPSTVPSGRGEVGDQQVADDDARATAASRTATSAAIPTPTGGHSAVTVPCRYASRSPIFAAA